MGIVIPERIDLVELSESLLKRGWKEGRFNGRKAFIKEVKDWLWICDVTPEGVAFFSFSEEESSETHSKGIRELKKEVEDLAREIGFSIPGKLEDLLWR